MAIIKNLEVTVLSNQQLCIEYEYPSDEGRFQTTAFKHVVSTTGASLEIELELRPSFQFTSFDALLFDIHLDGRLVYFGLLDEGNKKAIMKDITREKTGRWKTRSFIFADVQAQDRRIKPDLPPCSAAHSDPPPTIEPQSSAGVDPSSIGSEPRHSGPWKDLTYANRKETLSSAGAGHYPNTSIPSEESRRRGSNKKEKRQSRCHHQKIGSRTRRQIQGLTNSSTISESSWKRDQRSKSNAHHRIWTCTQRQQALARGPYQRAILGLC